MPGFKRTFTFTFALLSILSLKMKFKYFVLVGILLLASCSIDKAPQDKIVFGVDTVTMASAPVFVAEAKGFWKKEGLDVEIKPFVSGRLALDALVGKSVDAGYKG